MSETRKPFLRLTKDDFEIQTFRSGGPGGQHQNKTETGVRIIHRASGATGECRSERSQHQNRVIAFKRLAADPKLVAWIKRVVAEKDGIIAAAEAYAEREINTPEHLRIEVKRDGRWVETDGGE